MTYLASNRVGRIALHVIAMIGDRAYQWHLAGIRRELPARAALFFTHDLTLLTVLTLLTISA